MKNKTAIERMLEEFGLGSSQYGKIFENFLGKETIVRGVQTTVGPDGIPRISYFSNEGNGITHNNGDNREIPIETINDKKNNVIRVVAEVPGVDKDNININVKDDEINISASREEKKYSGTAKLDSGVDVDSAKATYTNGILEVVFTVNKVPSGTKIEIQ